MSKQDSYQGFRRPATLTARSLDALRVWNDARRSARHDDSIFIWIPKNAGTSVFSMLQSSGLVKLNTTRSIRLCFRDSGRVTFGHMAIGSLVDLKLVSQSFVDRSFKFALVRNPYDRAVSLYRYLSGIAVLENWHSQPSFRQFLTILADGHYDRIGPFNWRGLSQANPQSAWLADCPADEIYPIEELGSFAADISKRWNIPLPELAHLNRSDQRGPVDLDREDKLLIEKIYAEDFKSFGYGKR